MDFGIGVNSGNIHLLVVGCPVVYGVDVMTPERQQLAQSMQFPDGVSHPFYFMDEKDVHSARFSISSFVPTFNVIFHISAGGQ